LPGQAGSSRRVTIRDVAERAGVSIGTASKALKWQGQAEGRHEAPRHHGGGATEVAPNQLARGLVEGRSYTIGMITNDRFGRLCGPVMLGAEDTLGVSQISAFICDSKDDPRQERQHLKLLRSHAVDGMIVIGHRIEPRPSVGSGLGIPVIYAMSQSLDNSEPVVIPDDFGGGRAAAAHLISGGCRRLAHITGPDHLPGCAQARGRVLSGSLRGPGGNDQIARGASEVLRHLGRVIPADVAVVGFDNWEPVVLGADPAIDECRHAPGRHRPQGSRATARRGRRAAPERPAHPPVPACPERLISLGKTASRITLSWRGQTLTSYKARYRDPQRRERDRARGRMESAGFVVRRIHRDEGA
jgi:LacI family transcriptional regulator